MQALPEVATAPVLVLVGAMMMSEAGQVDWTRMTVALPAFLTMVVQVGVIRVIACDLRVNGYRGCLIGALLRHAGATCAEEKGFNCVFDARNTKAAP